MPLHVRVQNVRRVAAPLPIAASIPIADVFSGRRTWHVEHGNCIDPVAGLARLPDLSIDHAIFDPPYSRYVHENARTNKRVRRGQQGVARVELGFAHLSTYVRNRVAVQLARLVKRWILIFSDERGGVRWIEALENVGLEYVRWGTWIRKGTMPQVSGDRPGVATEVIIIAHRPGKKRWNGGGRAALWETVLAGRDGTERWHATQKPIDLMISLVRDFTERGDLIADPFAGSGTTGEAALRLGRRCLLWERRKRDVHRCVRRLSGVLQQLDMEGEHPIFVPEPPAAKKARQESLFGFCGRGAWTCSPTPCARP